MVKLLLNDLFGSLSDTTRRDMLLRLASSELTVTQLAKTYAMSLPAISKHLRVLNAAGLIIREKRGRQNFVRLAPVALSEASEHLLYYEALLHNRLDSFVTHLHQKKSEETSQKSTVTSSPKKLQTIVVTAIVEATPETAWLSYTDPEEIKKWWNLPETRLETIENGVYPGGTWRFNLTGFDGRDYTIGGKYTTVSYPHRLEYSDGIGDPGSVRPEAQVIITFEQLPNGKTLLTKKSTATPAVHQLNASWCKVVGGG